MSVKHVYILGAGFSVPLGGPLFGDLLTPRMQTRLSDLFERNHWPNPDKAMLESIPKVIGNALGGFNQPNRVDLNAEQVLELAEVLDREDLDISESEEIVNKKLNWLARILFWGVYQAGSSGANNQRKTTRLVFQLLKCRLAMETNYFLIEIESESERWIPYDRWYKGLRSNDTLLTTNYDLALESLEERWKAKNNYPATDTDSHSVVTMQRRQHGPTLMKLHGSCNWYLANNQVMQNPKFDPVDLLSRDLVIGTPGLGKSKLADSLLAQQWQFAEHELQQAEVISIVGYSLPETDNRLRMMILDSISKSKTIKCVNIVLGMRNERGYRAEEVIRQAMPTKELRDKVILRNMYAQDFLPIADKLAREAVAS